MFRAGIMDDKVESETYKDFFSNHLLYYGGFGFFIALSFAGIVVCSIYIHRKEKFEYSKNKSEEE